MRTTYKKIRGITISAPIPRNKVSIMIRVHNPFRARRANSYGSMPQGGNLAPTYARCGRPHSGICREGSKGFFKCSQTSISCESVKKHAREWYWRRNQPLVCYVKSPRARGFAGCLHWCNSSLLLYCLCITRPKRVFIFCKSICCYEL